MDVNRPVWQSEGIHAALLDDPNFADQREIRKELPCNLLKVRFESRSVRYHPASIDLCFPFLGLPPNLLLVLLEVKIGAGVRRKVRGGTGGADKNQEDRQPAIDTFHFSFS
jgi:hypothetical protein